MSLYVNGELLDVLGDDERVEGRPMTATLMMPVERVGSTTSAYIGYIDDVRVAEAAEAVPASTMDLDHIVITAEQVLKGEDIPGMRELLDRAYVLFREAYPSAEEIESLVSQIEAKLEASKYERADYCRVDAYLKLVQNDVMKSLYDAASLRRLETAVGQVRRDLPKSMQSTVNAYENALVNVLADMNLLPQNNLRVIDAGLLKAEASSAHQGDPAEKVLDGNVNSICHSDYPNGPTSGDITLTLSVNDKKAPTGTAFDVNGIIVTPRQNGNNGDLKKYKVEVSTDGKSFTEVTTGTASFDGKKPLEIATDLPHGSLEATERGPLRERRAPCFSSGVPVAGCGVPGHSESGGFSRWALHMGRIHVTRSSIFHEKRIEKANSLIVPRLHCETITKSASIGGAVPPS